MHEKSDRYLLDRDLDFISHRGTAEVPDQDLYRIAVPPTFPSKIFLKLLGVEKATGP